MMDWEAAAAGRDNVTCARDLAALLEMLVAGRPADRRRGLRERAARRLRCRSTATACRAACRPAPPTPASPATTCREGRFCHDCGVVTTPAGETLVLAVLTDGEGGYDAVAARGAASTTS